jgi:hypothetical protein
VRTVRASLSFLLLFLAPCFSQDRSSFRPPQPDYVVRSETVLSGIGLYDTTYERAFEMYGKPTHVKATGGVDRFEWESGSCRLTLVARGKWITSIDVRGTRPDCVFGSTGRGLKLGDRIDDAKRIYPLRYSPGIWLPGYPRDCRMHPTLEIDINSAGTISHMTLSDNTACY